MYEVALIQARKIRNELESLQGDERISFDAFAGAKDIKNKVLEAESRIQKKIKAARDRLSLKIYNNGVLVADNVTELDITGATNVSVSGNRITITR